MPATRCGYRWSCGQWRWQHQLPDYEGPVFVDARIWIFPDDVWNEYLQISGAQEGWEDALDRREIRWAVLERRFHWFQLVPAMNASSRWEKVYEDETGLIFRRR